MLRMDAVTDQTYALNEAVLLIDLDAADTALSELYISFFQAESTFGDEEHDLSSYWSDHEDGDGVSVSQDGIYWYQIVSASELATDSDGLTISVKLSTKLADIMALDPDFGFGDYLYIKFQQYDDYANTKDGRDWDNIAVGGDEDGDGTPDFNDPDFTGTGSGTGTDEETDTDEDGIADESDNCPLTANADQTDSDIGNFGDACDVDDTGLTGVTLRYNNSEDDILYLTQDFTAFSDTVLPGGDDGWVLYSTSTSDTSPPPS
ncbi:MAG: thrombospondin type 3 repeat-containing protein [Magnetococcales bacterium]|nr:thrombospondin type 3 repeat-containing protein [Magnetococcales bacterium]